MDMERPIRHYLHTDYVSLGTTDDTQLDVDALGLSVVIISMVWYKVGINRINIWVEMPISS